MLKARFFRFIEEVLWGGLRVKLYFNLGFLVVNGTFEDVTMYGWVE